MDFTNAIIAAESFTLLVCAAILYGNIFETHQRSERKFLFSFLVISTMIGTVFDLVTWALDGKESFNAFSYPATAVSLLMTFVMAAIFGLFMNAILKEGDRGEIPHTLLRCYLVFCSIGIVVTLVGSISGGFFTLENGNYEDGPYYWLYTALNLLTLVFGIALIARFRKSLGRHDSFACYLYIFIPFLSAFISLLNEDFSFSYCATAISLLLAYVMIQSDHAEQLEKENISKTLEATHDELTGLLNRRAYIEMLEEIGSSEGVVGVIFGDLNGLKYTNDHLGHAAGDQLLKDFAEVLIGIFRKNEIFRISGDEFVAILPGLREDVFEERIQRLESLMFKNGSPMACIGSAYGKRGDVKTLVKDAESKMYAVKAEFHRKHPELSR